ncbi:flagellar filament capping protein FliD [Metapseudomonas resinovorans]|uniref:Flagellar hook-associated protein 2 n=1 Tax=Metapseudomonas resinovorans NBRC 106553 TaxID=1245471 RepID=S6AUT1_METRE|nr:flagellar filament capping protein FliD [Pseudomonas resinovorans]BAN49938.1 flagellar hook-associated protein FliD [Pseudomonas resinovorans NBRC 106553]
MAIDSDYVKQMASQLANYEVQSALTKANRNQTAYKSQLTAVTTLDTALKSFSSAIKGLKSSSTSMLVNKATFSKEGVATATVGPKAVSGSYQFFVEQLASSHQVALQGLTTDDIDTQGELTIGQDGKSFKINLASIDTDGDGKNSLDELAAAINAATDNTGVKASLLRSNGQVSLVLGAEKSGAANAISLSLSGTDSASSVFENAVANRTELSAAKDARVRLGGETGMLLTNASNTFDSLIDGVSLTFNQTHKSGDQPLQVDIGQDQAGTSDQVKKFVDAFNTLMGTFDTLTASGGEDGSTRGVLAGDSGVRAIESMLNQLVRKEFGGATLINFGISADRNGKLSIDAARFEKAVAADPQGLEQLFRDKDSLLDSVDKSLSVYTSSVNGLMKNRKESLNLNLKRVDQQFDAIEKQYDNYYNRYLKQYTSMMQIMDSMSQTSGMFQ